MRYLISLFLSVLVMGLSSCKDTNEKNTQDKESIALAAADWSDTTALAKAIDVFYKDSVLKQGNISLKVRDAFMRSSNPYQYLQLHKIYRSKFKLAAPTVGYMPVLMLSGKDSAIVDFQISWLRVNPNDSIGKFVVTDKFLQTIENQSRYEWIQEDNYWIRKNVEAPSSKELLNNREKKISTMENKDAI